jgi:hypothetical protein
MLGKEHPSPLTTINKLALVLRDQGKHKQGEEMYRQELRLCETVSRSRLSIHTNERE